MSSSINQLFQIYHCVRFIKMYRCTAIAARCPAWMRKKGVFASRWIIRIRKRALKALFFFRLSISATTLHGFSSKRLKHIFLASRLFRGNKVDLFAPLSLLELFPVVWRSAVKKKVTCSTERRGHKTTLFRKIAELCYSPTWVTPKGKGIKTEFPSLSMKGSPTGDWKKTNYSNGKTARTP